MAARDERDAEAVVRGVDADLAQPRVEAVVFLAVQLAGDSCSLVPQSLQGGPERGMDRYLEEFARIVLIALGVPHRDRVAVEIHAGHGDLALAEPASAVKADLDHVAKPARFRFCLFADGRDLRVGELRLFLLRRLCDARSRQGIRLAVLATNSLVHDLREEFELQQRGVVFRHPAPHLLHTPPRHVILCVRVFHPPGVERLALREKLPQHGPCDEHAPARGGFVHVMPVDPVRHPVAEERRRAWCADAFLLERFFVRHALRLARVILEVGAQTRGFLAPHARVEVPILQSPKRGVVAFSDKSHGHHPRKCHKVPQAETALPCANPHFPPYFLQSPQVENSTVTPRDIVSPSVADRVPHGCHKSRLFRRLVGKSFSQGNASFCHALEVAGVMASIKNSCARRTAESVKTLVRNDQIALGHADDPGLFVRITDHKRGKWEFVEWRTHADTFATEMEAIRALWRIFKSNTPRYIVPRKVVGTC